MTSPVSADLLTELRASFPETGPDPRCGFRPGMTDAGYNRYWLARVARKTVENENGCWVWQGTILTKGYGGTTYRSRNVAVHRQGYRLLVKADLATADFICHRCDNPPCWNPAHLWIGTNGQNQRDAGLKGRHQESKKTHCPQGHEYSPENTYVHEVRPGTWSRMCLTCQRERMKKPEYIAKARERARRRRAEKQQAQRGAA